MSPLRRNSRLYWSSFAILRWSELISTLSASQIMDATLRCLQQRELLGHPADNAAADESVLLEKLHRPLVLLGRSQGRERSKIFSFPCRRVFLS